ncbi:MAG: GNAT family N-acetyltransferase [Alphaproteobacteria bacterium]
MHSGSAEPQAGAAIGRLTAHLAPQPDLEALGAAWRTLQRDCPHSFFQSWSWIGCLARATGRTPQVMSVRDGERLVGLAAWFEGPVALPWQRRLALSELGDERYDRVYIEYNGVLAMHGHDDAIRRATLSFLQARARPWLDRFLLGGVPSVYADLARSLGWRVYERDSKEVFSLALTDLDAPNRHLAMLSRNVRQHIRRSLRFYARPPALTVAGSVDEALAYMARLKVLHQASWRRRGRAGAFAEPFFETFHRRLIEENFDKGHVELVRVAAGDEDIGYLYNFIYGDRVYFYQSGLRYFDDNRARPGLVSHHLCIEAHAKAGRQHYDFMAGAQRYKTDLGARPSGRLNWIELRRPLSDHLRGSLSPSKGMID